MHRHAVLLIEDEEELASLLGELLRDLDYEVRVAGSFGEAKEMLTDFRPCTVVSDLTLPDVPREELVARLREEVGDLPIRLMSAIAESELRRFALDQGAQGALSKPFDLDDFERVVVQDCPHGTSAAPPGLP